MSENKKVEAKTTYDVSYYKTLFLCSYCGMRIDLYVNKWYVFRDINYCPRCGAYIKKQVYEEEF